jgi:hypothetical protein
MPDPSNAPPDRFEQVQNRVVLDHSKSTVVLEYIYLVLEYIYLVQNTMPPPGNRHKPRAVMFRRL